MTNSNRLTTIDSHDHDRDHHHPHHAEEEVEEAVNIFPVRIFDAQYIGEAVPAGFDTVKISLDGTIKADLSWKKEREAALEYAAQGLRIFWEIDLGLPGSLQNALGNKTQFLGLSLSLEHFCNTLWKEFRKETVGLCLYRGSADFSQNYPWDDEQVQNLQECVKDQYREEGLIPEKVDDHLQKCFCRDAVGEYLSLLASRVPDSLALFLLFDTSGVEDPMLTAKLLTKERYPRFHLGVKGLAALGSDIAWEEAPTEKGAISRELGAALPNERARLGFCVPRMTISKPSSTVLLKEALETLLRRGVPFRVIPEVNLAVEWDGLDHLIVDTQHVEIQFKRKLQGFCAAGGTVVYIGKPLGLAQEVVFKF